MRASLRAGGVEEDGGGGGEGGEPVFTGGFGEGDAGGVEGGGGEGGALAVLGEVDVEGLVGVLVDDGDEALACGEGGRVRSRVDRARIKVDRDHRRSGEVPGEQHAIRYRLQQILAADVGNRSVVRVRMLRRVAVFREDDVVAGEMAAERVADSLAVAAVEIDASVAEGG